MIEEYENWEDSIRRTFIELANYMEKHANPLESIIDFAWAAGADLFFVQNAKDELKKLKEKNKEWAAEVYRANEFAVKQTNEYLEMSKQMQLLKDSLDNPVAWAKINNRGDLFDLRLQNNPYYDQTKIVPLFKINHE
jgi:uncharacterized protein YozE (UPF0346 family)